MTSSTINLIKKLLQVLHYYTLVLNSLEILILLLSDTAVIRNFLFVLVRNSHYVVFSCDCTVENEVSIINIMEPL